MRQLFFLLLLAVMPHALYSQRGNTKILPAHSGMGDSMLPYPLVKWGYKDLHNDWVISPTFVKAKGFDKEGIAEVIISQTQGMITQIGLIDLNGDLLASYKSSTSQKRRDKKYEQVLQMVSERNARGLYDDIYARFARIDADIVAQQQRERARQDSILMVQQQLKMRADSIATAKCIADSILLAQEQFINAIAAPGEGLSLQKVKVTGHGLLLSNDETWREYTIRLDDFNRLLITHEGDTRLRGELDVLKVIYESDWGILSNDRFHGVEVSKMTAEISQGAFTRKFGVFSFLFILDLNNLDMAYTDEETTLTVLNSISQVERYITSFMRHCQGAAHFVEPLFQVKVGGREGITVGIVDRQGNGASLEDVKRTCNEARRRFTVQ